MHALALVKAPLPEGGVRRSAKDILAEVAARLGNTVAVCRKAYVHPGVLDLALRGMPEDDEAAAAPLRPTDGLSAAERDLIRFLAASS